MITSPPPVAPPQQVQTSAPAAQTASADASASTPATPTPPTNTVSPAQSPVAPALVQPDSKPAFNTIVSLSPKTHRTVAKVTDVETGEVVLSIPPELASATYSAANASEESGLVTSSLS